MAVNKKQYVVKVQLPIMGDMSQILIYTQDRKIEQMFPAKGELLKDLQGMMEGEPKAFFYAHTDENKFLVIDDPAPWQNW